MSIEIWNKTENISAQREKNSTLLTEVLFHSSGHGSAFEGATPSCITDSRRFQMRYYLTLKYTGKVAKKA